MSKFQFEVGERVFCTLEYDNDIYGTHTILALEFMEIQKFPYAYITDRCQSGINECFLRKITPLEELL